MTNTLLSALNSIRSAAGMHFDIATIQKIGEQVKTLVRANGVDDNRLVSNVVTVCDNLRVKCPRGVELITKGFIPPLEMGLRRRLIVEGFLWELHALDSWLHDTSKAAMESLSRLLTERLTFSSEDGHDIHYSDFMGVVYDMQLLGNLPKENSQPTAGGFNEDIRARVTASVTGACLRYAGRTCESAVAGVVDICLSLRVTSPGLVEKIANALLRGDLDESIKHRAIVEAVIDQNSVNPDTDLPINRNQVFELAQIAARHLDPRLAVSYDHVMQVIKETLATCTSPESAVREPRKQVQMLVLEENFYLSTRVDDHFVVSREYGIHPKSQMPMQGTWVMRNYHTGEFIDSDRYINDLAERNNFNIHF